MACNAWASDAGCIQVDGCPDYCSGMTNTELHAGGDGCPGQAVITHGLATYGDGGGGRWYWDASQDKANANFGLIIDTTVTFSTPLQGSGVGTGCWVRESTSKVNADWFGAIGDGVTDDYAALLATTDYCVSSGSDMELTQGKDFAVNMIGRLLYGCNVYAQGATITYLSATNKYYCISNYPTDASATYDDKTIFGLTIDAGFFAMGIYLEGATNYTVTECEIINCINGGVHMSNCVNAIISNNVITGVKYQADGTAAADGVFSQHGHRNQVINNIISDFRRIGIVSEGSVDAKSDDMDCSHNTIFYGHSAIDSATEFNAGIWYENSNGGVIIGNTVYNMTGLPEQSGKTTYSVVVSRTQDRESTTTISNNILESHVKLAGDRELGSIIFDNNSVTLGSILVTEGRNVTISNTVIHNTDGGNGVTVWSDNAAADPLPTIGSLTIDNIRKTNAITSKNYGLFTIDVILGGLGSLIIRNCEDLSFVNRPLPGFVERMTISDCRIKNGSDGAYRIVTGDAEVSNCHFTDRAGCADYRRLISDSATAVLNATFSNCTFDTVDTEIILENKSVLLFNGCYFTNTQLSFSGAGSSLTKFDGCVVSEYPTSFIKTNFTNNTTEYFAVRNSDFRSTVDLPPFELWNTKPGQLLLQNNTYTTTLFYEAGLTPFEDTNNLKITDYLV